MLFNGCYREQACRGNKEYQCTKVPNNSTKTDGPISQRSNGLYKLPAHADFLTAYSTIPSAYEK